MVLLSVGKTVEFLKKSVLIKTLLKKIEKMKKSITHSILNFEGTHKFSEKYKTHLMKKNEIVRNKSILYGYTILQLSKFLIFETFYVVLQPYFDHGKLLLMYMETETFKLSVNIKDIVNDSKSLEDLFDFSNLNKVFFGNEKKFVVNSKQQHLGAFD